MAHARLRLADHARTTAFRRVVALLKADPELARVVRTWREAAGEPAEHAPPAVAAMPQLRLGATPAPSRWASTRTVVAPVVILIDLFVAGTDPDDLGNLWGVIEADLLPHHDPAKRQALEKAVEGFHGVMPLGLDVTTPPPRPDSEPWQRLVARLQIDLYLR